MLRYFCGGVRKALSLGKLRQRRVCIFPVLRFGLIFQRRPVSAFNLFPTVPEVAKVLDSKKVSDHHAIIPTMELAKADPDALPESEKNILTLAGAKLLSVLG